MEDEKRDEAGAVGVHVCEQSRLITVADIRVVLDECLHLIRSQPEQEDSFDVGYDQGAMWIVRGIASKFNIKLED